MVTFRLDNGGTCTVRNSGTEPKLKYYVECSGSSQEKADEVTANVASALIESVLQPKKFGLIERVSSL